MSAIIVFSGLILVGCGSKSSSSDTTRADGSMLISEDDGQTFTLYAQYGEGKTFADAQVLSFRQSAADPQRLYVGTQSEGIFVSDDRGVTWRHISFPPQKVYGLAVSATDAQTFYASGVLNKTARVYKTTDGGEHWDVVYTEPVQKTVITALAGDPTQADTVYIGVSSGVILRSRDGGATWSRLHRARGAVTSIAFDATDANTVYFGVFKRGLLKTRDGGETIEDFTRKLSGANSDERRDSVVYTVVTDPRTAGSVYVGTMKGVYRSMDYGNTWETLPIIGMDARKIPVRAIAISPHTPSQIVYTIGRTLYRSGSNFSEWTPVQFSAERSASVVWYDQEIPGRLYITTRKIKK